MSNKTLGWAVCAILLLVSMPVLTHAALTTLTWESPVDGQPISGIQIFRGHVFSDARIPVAVKLLVAGVSLEVPWGAARLDVAASDPALHSGFATAENVGNLPPGPVSITLEVREAGSSGACAAPSCVQQTRTFTVVKPGAREGEGAPFSFLSALNPLGANVTLDSTTGDLIVAPVAVQDSAGAGTRHATLRLRWVPNVQSFVTVSAAAGTSFSAVQAIFTQRCALSGCHDHSSKTQNLDLSAGQAFTSIVAMSSVENTELFRVNPGEDEQESYLYRKISGVGTIAGLRMPQGCPTQRPCLTQEEILTIEHWIQEGAPPPQP